MDMKKGKRGSSGRTHRRPTRPGGRTSFINSQDLFFKMLFQWDPKQIGEWIKCRSKKQNERRITELENGKVSVPSLLQSFIFEKQEPRGH